MKIITNSAISLDGKINTRNHSLEAIGSAQDHKRMKEIRNRADAVLVGGQTFRQWPHASLSEAHLSGQNTVPLWNVVVTRSGPLDLSEEFLSESRAKPLVLAASKDFAQGLAVDCEVCEKDLNPEWIVQTLAKRGIKVLLVEGGGRLIHPFLQSRLVDEMYVTVCPRLVGDASAPSLVSGEGFVDQKVIGLELLDSQTVDQELFLHYKVVK